jgi:hypothetical protein
MTRLPKEKGDVISHFGRFLHQIEGPSALLGRHIIQIVKPTGSQTQTATANAAVKSVAETF